jgi:hypothetical protein
MKVFLVSVFITWLSSCTPAQPSAPDMTPVGDGLSVIGYSLIAVAVVITLGKLLK